MLVTFLDDSYTFDGSTKDNHPLGGSEKSLILLAESLATIGHIVRVFNNCERTAVINNVSWNPIKNMKATHSDVWIVHNNPLLFNQIDNKNWRYRNLRDRLNTLENILFRMRERKQRFQNNTELVSKVWDAVIDKLNQELKDNEEYFNIWMIVG